MSLYEVVIEGTLKPDGTLQLDQNPGLPPGRVTVVLRQESTASPQPQEDWWQFMQRTRHELEAAGCRFLTDEEVTAHIEWLREGDHIDELLREADNGGQSKDHP
jgi:hypothetical protein